MVSVFLDLTLVYLSFKQKPFLVSQLSLSLLERPPTTTPGPTTRPPRPGCLATSRPTLVTIGSCQGNETITECDGKCYSNSFIPKDPNPGVIVNCLCCAPSSVKSLSTTMYCVDGSSYTRHYIAISACHCMECGSQLTQASPVLNLIEQLNAESKPIG